MIKTPKVLGIFCHPDDEILWGWPIFQSDKYEKYLIICCSDAERNRPNRKKALQEVCKLENINLVSCLDEPNDFYALPTRRADYLLTDAIINIERAITTAVEAIKPDLVFTHNPVGEYGHGSHRLLFEIVSQHEHINEVLITDICQKSNHRSHCTIPKFVLNAYYTQGINKFALKPEFFYRCKKVYDQHSAWTWCYEPVHECALFKVRT